MFNTDNIKRIRINNNLSQSEVAKALKVSRSSYAMWESNNNIFPLKRLNDFCNLMKCSLDYCFVFTNDSSLITEDINLNKMKIRLKEFRKENNLTQNKLCEFLHIDQPTWSAYESGKNLIGTPFLFMICKKYKISADYLLGRTDEPKYLN